MRTRYLSWTPVTTQSTSVIAARKPSIDSGARAWTSPGAILEVCHAEPWPHEWRNDEGYDSCFLTMLSSSGIPRLLSFPQAKGNPYKGLMRESAGRRQRWLSSFGKVDKGENPSAVTISRIPADETTNRLPPGCPAWQRADPPESSDVQKLPCRSSYCLQGYRA